MSKNNENLVQNVARQHFDKYGTVQLTSDEAKHLNKQYDNKVVNDIQNKLEENRVRIEKVASKAFTKLLQHYGPGKPLHFYLDKALKHKDSFSSAEFAEFQKQIQLKFLGQSEIKVPGLNSNMSYIARLLGSSTSYKTGIIYDNKNKANNDILQNIFKAGEEALYLHGHVIQQSSSHTHAANIIPVPRDPHKEDLNIHVPHVVIALFANKIPYVETSTIYSSLFGIMKNKYHRMNSIPLPGDYQLMRDLMLHPTKMMCSSGNVIDDMYRRVLIQHALWLSVYCLRTGKLFNITNSKLITALGRCNVSEFDRSMYQIGGNPHRDLDILTTVFGIHPLVVTHTALAIKSSIVVNPALYMGGSGPGIEMLRYITIDRETHRHAALGAANPSVADMIKKQTVLKYTQNGVMQFQQDLRHANGFIPIIINRSKSRIATYGATYGYVDINNAPLNVAGLVELDDYKIDVDKVITLDNKEFKLVASIGASTQNVENINYIKGYFTHVSDSRTQNYYGYHTGHIVEFADSWTTRNIAAEEGLVAARIAHVAAGAGLAAYNVHKQAAATFADAVIATGAIRGAPAPAPPANLQPGARAADVNREIAVQNAAAILHGALGVAGNAPSDAIVNFLTNQVYENNNAIILIYQNI